MKRKLQRVPDFSSAKRSPRKGEATPAPGAPGAPGGAAGASAPKPPPARTSAKPQATSSKSGHRGS